MTDENKEELASLYALGLLSGAERAAFQAELDADPQLRALTRSLQAAAMQLAQTAPAAEPSPQLRSRIFTSIDKLNTAEPRPKQKTWVAAWAGWAVAAGLAIAVGLLGMRLAETRSELNAQKMEAASASLNQRSLEQKLADAESAASRRIAALQGENSLDQLKIAKLAALNGNSPDALAIAVWNPSKQQGVLTVQDFPKIGEDQSYQLWIIDAQHKNPVSSGVFSVDARGRARLDFHPAESAEAATQFAISRERKGGAPTPHGPIVAAGTL